MANAAGGRLIYGIAEVGAKGEKRAGNFAPVMDDRVSVDWINQVVASRTSPPIRSIEINSIEIDSGGRIFVLDIPQGDTAHQSLFSHVYHQRIGAQVMPMQDFQIRDVMNRRSGPVLEISLSREPKSKKHDRHVYDVFPVVRNLGNLTVSNWRLQVFAPKSAYMGIVGDEALKYGNSVVAVDAKPVDREDYIRFTYSSSSLEKVHGSDLHPGEIMTLKDALSLPPIRLMVGEHNYWDLDKEKMPLHWEFFSLNARPSSGVMEFDDWCDY